LDYLCFQLFAFPIISTTLDNQENSVLPFSQHNSLIICQCTMKEKCMFISIFNNDVQTAKAIQHQWELKGWLWKVSS